ncbi:MAG: hypothetical protein AB1640_23105 [bacterium]
MAVLFIFVLVALFGSVLLHETTTLASGAAVQARALQSLCLARSGLAWALLERSQAQDLDGDGIIGQIGSPDGATTRPLGGGDLWVQQTQEGGHAALMANGRFQGITKNIRRME